MKVGEVRTEVVVLLVILAAVLVMEMVKQR
jgi:hypothetical protein